MRTRLRAPQRRADWRSGALLVAIVVITALPYVTGLSFYSDDWYILATFQADVGQHRFGLGSALRGFETRPVQGIYLAAMYALFGLRPLGYHLVNLAVIAASVALFERLLIRLRFERVTAMAAALILIALPQLSTVRAWVSASQIPLSMLAALLALHCQLSLVETARRRWLIGAGVAALISVAAYEIFAPIIVAFAVWLWMAGRGRPSRTTTRAAAVIPLVIVVAVMAMKLILSDRVPGAGVATYAKGLIQLTRPDYDWRIDNGLNLFAAVSVHFWWPVLGAARAVGGLIGNQLEFPAVAASVAAAALSFAVIRQAGPLGSDLRKNRRLLLFGGAAFALGHAVFLVTPAMLFSPAGSSNRVLVAAALGVAMIVVAAIRAVANFVSSTMKSSIFAAGCSALVFVGTLRIEQVESSWVRAGRLEAAVMRSASVDLKSVPTGAVVVLDNTCPYAGPAIVMEAPWDISGAFSLAAGRTIRGDAVSDRMSVQQSGLSSSIYGEPAFYPYGSSLYAYHPMKHSLVPLPDRAAAAAYFAARRSPACPPGFPGHGVLI